MVGLPLTFTLGIDNLNVDETLVAFQWDLDGNGTFESTTTSNVRTSNPYTTAGIFTAKAVATTSSGRTATGTVRVVVTN
jgi:hypothetical protein